MLEGNNENPVTTQESYAGAVSTGNTRLEPHKTTRADLIAAAGMSVHSMGTALMRLVSEWQSGATPPKVAQTPDSKELARRAAVERVNSGIAAAEEEYGGMRVEDKEQRRAAAPVTKQEMEFGQAEARRLQAQATDWNIEENKLRFQRMKSLPMVRAGLLYWVQERGWEDGERLVAGVLQYFLSPKCSVCGGSGVREFAGNNRRGAGKPCRVCKQRLDDRKIKVMGEAPIPDHGRGRALLAHITSCVARAAGDIREGAYRRHRADEEGRADRRKHEKIAQLQRADAEARADEATDTAAVAAHFAKSMIKTRRNP